MSPPYTEGFRLMTWNIRSLRDDREAVVAVVRRFAPDVLFVQEAPRFFRARSKLAALARRTDLVVASGGRPAAEVAILTRLRVAVHEAKQWPLPRTPGLHQRGVSTATLSVAGRTVTGSSMHLGLDRAERLRHAAQVKDQTLEAAPDSVVLAGDFNEKADGRAWRLLAAGLTDVGAVDDLPTYPAAAPQRRIDGLFVPTTWRTRLVSPTEIVDGTLLARATDHLPVVVDVVD